MSHRNHQPQWEIAGRKRCSLTHQNEAPQTLRCVPAKRLLTTYPFTMIHLDTRRYSTRGPASSEVDELTQGTQATYSQGIKTGWGPISRDHKASDAKRFETPTHRFGLESLLAHLRRLVPHALALAIRYPRQELLAAFPTSTRPGAQSSGAT